MFSQSGDREDAGRSRVVLIVFAVAIAALVGGVVLFSKLAPAPAASSPTARGLANGVHAGDPTYERYSKLVRLDKQEYYTSSNMLGQMLASGTGTLINTSDKTLTGVELTGTVIGKGDKVLATAIALPVPRVRATLPPQGSMPFTVAIDGLPKDTKKSDIVDIRVVLTGLEMQ